jgi:hypothetical protein
MGRELNMQGLFQDKDMAQDFSGPGSTTLRPSSHSRSPHHNQRVDVLFVHQCRPGVEQASLVGYR